ncbi:MAG: FAD-dependent oxidoreductase [Faecalibacterium sp.]|jgi:hypothetical protein|nr:FAD-dependent oxidoreductase [Faecalibacterium sp.]
MNRIPYAGKQIPVLGEYDAVIAGGGAAGAACGIQCAKSGLKTLIVEKYGMLGGTACHALVCPMMPTYTDHLEVFSLIEDALKQNGTVTRDGTTTMVWFAPEVFGETLERLYTAHGGHLLYDATLVDAVCEDGRIRYLVLMTVEGLAAVGAESFVDATGDALLTRLAGVPADAGDAEGINQVSSLRFLMGGIDVEKYRAYCLSLHDEFSPLKTGYFFESAMVNGRGFKLEPTFREGVAEGLLEEEDLRYYQAFSIPGQPGCMAFNCPHLASMKQNTGAAARSAALAEGHIRIRRLANFLQKKMPGFENSYLLRTADMLGIRESWRMRGKYVLTEQDYSSKARFADGLVKGDWYIDVHSSKKGLFHQNTYQHGDYYEIPYRSMICTERKNLIVAGRCISATFLMQASVRILPTVIDMGDAAGSACALAKATHTPLNLLDGTKLRRI